MNKNDDRKKDSNPDPVTKAPGFHPIGTGMGAAAGGAAAGAAAGTVAGPAGTLAGAVVGAVVGGLAGKGIAEKIDPSVEDAYWRENHNRQSYGKTTKYDDYAPAYRVGYEGYRDYGLTGKSWEDSESDIRNRYQSCDSNVDWNSARPAARAAWDRTHLTYGKGAQQDERRPR